MNCHSKTVILRLDEEKEKASSVVICIVIDTTDGQCVYFLFPWGFPDSYDGRR